MIDAEQQQDQSMPYYPSGSNIHANFMGDLTNPEEIINGYEMLLKGFRRVQGQYVKCGEPLVNADGINSIMFQIRGFMNQVSILSYLSEADIKMLIHQQLGRNLIIDLMINKKTYNIKNDSDRSKILSTAQSICYICLMRALNGNDKGFWGKVSMFIGSDVNAKESGSLLSKFNPFKK